MAEKRVSVRLFAQGGRQVRAELEGIGEGGAQSFKRLSSEVDITSVMLRRLAGIAAGAFSIRQVVDYADTWTDLRSRVDLATGAQERGALVMDRLADMARRTYSSLEQTTESWLSNSTALREMGLSTAESLDFTEALNNAMVVSGARAERATSVQYALSKAMATGVLRGEELNRIIEAGGRVAELLAAELDTTVSGLRQLGPQGKITGDVIRTALVGNLELLRAEADSMPATIGDAFTLIGNAALRLVGAWDQMLVASGTVADVLIMVADNMERLAAIALAFAGIMAGRWVAAFVAARLATFSLTGAMMALRGAILRTGIGVLAIAAGEMIYRFGRLVQATGGFSEAMAMMGDLGRAVWSGLGEVVGSLVDDFRAIKADIEAIWTSLMASLAQKWADFLGTIGPTFNAVSERIGSDLNIDWIGAAAWADGLRNASSNAGRMADTYRERAQSARSGAFMGAAAAIDAMRQAIARLDAEGDLSALNDVSLVLEDIETGASQAGGSLAKAMAAAKAPTEAVSKVMDTLRDSMASTFASIVTGAESARDAIGKLLQSLASTLANKAFQTLFNSLPIFGGGGAAPIPTFARGGTHAGGLRLVGELGPELEATGPARYWSTAQTAAVLRGGQNHGQSGGGGAGVTVNLNVDARGAVDGVASQVVNGVRALIPEIERHVVASVANKRSRGYAV